MFQLPRYKRAIIVADTEVVYDLGGFLSAGWCPLSQWYYDDIKVWLVQSQDPDVSLISQIDIVMCFIYNMLVMSWRYQGWCHSNIVTISECPLGHYQKAEKINLLRKSHWGSRSSCGSSLIELSTGATVILFSLVFSLIGFSLWSSVLGSSLSSQW